MQEFDRLIHKAGDQNATMDCAKKALDAHEKKIQAVEKEEKAKQTEAEDAQKFVDYETIKANDAKVAKF